MQHSVVFPRHGTVTCHTMTHGRVTHGHANMSFLVVRLVPNTGLANASAGPAGGKSRSAAAVGAGAGAGAGAAVAPPPAPSALELPAPGLGPLSTLARYSLSALAAASCS